MATLTSDDKTLLSAATFAAINQTTAAASGLPNEAYTDAEFFRRERDLLLGQGWACIGFDSDVATPGAAQPVDFMGLPLLMLRDKDSAVRVFHNVCSHRGMRLLTEPCRLRGVLRCPYHSWTYGLDGALRGTPHIGGPEVHEVNGFRRDRYGLKTVRSAVWLGLVFVNLSGDAPPFADSIAPVLNRWRKFWGDDGPERLRQDPDGQLELSVQANWKLAVENYCEAYHLPWVHPSLNSYSRLEDHYPIAADGDPFAGQGSTAYTLADVAGIQLPLLPGWPEDRLKNAEYLALYPNLLLGLQADHFYAVVLEPQAVDRTRERLQLYYVGDAAVSDATAAARQATQDSWRIVFGEDVTAVEGMQAGRYSPAFRGGVFSPVLDVPTHHFHRWAAARLAQPQEG